ncbi:MAG: type II secretion system F family protein [Suipraeoptans sp.]
MSKKQREPEYIKSAINTPMINYQVYYMNMKEKILTFFVAFFAGGGIGLVFYGGQFRNSDGMTTDATTISNVILFVLIGFIVTIIFFPIRRKQLLLKRKDELTQQFRSFLEALSTSLSSGMNMNEALNSAYTDLSNNYSKGSYILMETKEIISGLKNNVSLESMLDSFGYRSQIDDIKNFGVVFNVCYRAGGNLNDVVRRTNTIISEKIEISAEIETALASNRSQFTAMMVIPVVMMLLLRVMSSAFAASFATPAGIVAITVAIGLFALAYRLGQKIMSVKE